MVIEAGVIGHPIAHSLSPALHTRWLRAFGIDGRYQAIDCAAEGFREKIEELRDGGFAGVNVTAPFKGEALALADRPGPAARLLGGANTLTFTRSGIEAENTDAEGAAAALAAHLTPDHTRALVLGAGGTAPAILHALSGLGISRRAVSNRTAEKANVLADRFDAEAIGWEARNKALVRADILINATALGRPGTAPLGLDLGALPAHAIVMDVVYGEKPTPLVEEARARGLVALDGLPMLVGQAVSGFARWFGRVPEDLGDAEAYLRGLK